jgi:hypothetical protein
MPNYVVEYTRVFTHEIEADSLEHAGARSKNFAIGMSKSMGKPVKIISIHVEGYTLSTAAEPVRETLYETLVGGMRKSIDTMLE